MIDTGIYGGHSNGLKQAQPRGRVFVHEGLGHRQWTWGGSFEVFCVLGGPLAAAIAQDPGAASWLARNSNFCRGPRCRFEFRDVVLHFVSLRAD